MSERPAPAGNLACVPCRAIKTKCRRNADSGICERCTRKSLSCVFSHNKRGRKPRLHTLRDNSDQSGLPISSAPIRPVSPPVPSSTVNDGTGRRLSLSPSKQQNIGLESPDFWAESESLQPTGLLNQQAMRGKFSLENVLSTNHDIQAYSHENTIDVPENDPVRLGLLTHHIATSLFHGFMNSLNPFICVLDPDLYTFPYVQKRSSFLLTVILAAAAKAFNPTIHHGLQRHSEELFVESFRRCTKTIEAIQAILLLTYWKQPDDTRSFSNIGYAIRLSIELGLHKIKMDAADNPGMIPELVGRERKNAERTWFVLFVYDRGMNLQTGNPWMIERSDFIESVNTWYKSPLATPNDSVLAALVTLRLTTADIFELLIPQRPLPPADRPQRVNSLLRTLKPQLQAWQKHWTDITEKEACHRFLVSFWGSHARLLLYTFPLQASLSSPVGGSLVDNEALWTTYTSAIEMMQLVLDPSLAHQLSFAHDSVHTFLAYAAVFLIKLLLSVPSAIHQEIGPSIIKTIEKTAQTFAQQGAPVTFSCALQAKFLKNVLVEYQRAREQRFGRTQSRHHSSVPALFQNMADTAPQPQMDGIQSTEGSQYSIPLETHIMQSQRSSTSQSTSQLATNIESVPMSLDEFRCPDENPGTFAQNQFFNDDQLWREMFSNAGFNIHQGVFLPNN